MYSQSDNISRQGAAYRTGRTSVLDLCLTAIDEQFDPGNKTAVIRGEEHHRFGDFVRIAQPPQRDGGHGLRHDLLPLFLRLPQVTEARGLRRTTADSADPDLAGLQLQGPTAREYADPRIGRPVR